VALYVAGRLHEGTLRFNATPIDIPILLLLVSGLISVAVASDHRAALGLYRAYFIEPIALFYVAFDLLRVEDHFRQLLVAFAIGSCAFALLSIAIFMAALAQNRIQWGSPPSAIYGSANEVAMYLEPPLAFATSLILLASRRFDRTLGSVWAAFILVALILTISRGAFLALVAYVIFTVIALVRSFRKPLLIIIGAGALLFAATLLLGAHTPLVIHRLSLKALEYTSVTRFEIYGATLQMLLHHPIFGLGLGGYRYVFHEFPEIYPHDLWLTFWVELGLLGLLAFGYVFIWLLVTGWRGIHSIGGFDRVVLWGALGTFVLWGVHGVFDTPYWKNDMSAEFWLVAALQMAVLFRSGKWRALTEVGWRGYRAPANEPARPDAGAQRG
jgi:O-antigen ligase